MNTPNPISTKAFVLAIIIGLGVYWLVPKATRSDFDASFARWAVPFILLGGGYVVLKERAVDLEYHRSLSDRTELADQNLEKRNRYLFTLGWLFTAAGSVCLIRLLIHLT
jgi:hypothetical protein